MRQVAKIIIILVVGTLINFAAIHAGIAAGPEEMLTFAYLGAAMTTLWLIATFYWMMGRW